MECNKEEAARAKQIAEQKMEKKDFLGARKIAVKAQKLYSELENISQLIMVCDVHCSAENKICGTEMDWYGILKIEPTADDALIKKQFRKFALILHPDKNKFAGAADAFKLIGEAQSVLLDREKRKQHDNKCKSAVVNGAAKEANMPSNVRKAPGPGNIFMNSNTQFQQASQTSQTGSYSSRPTFWTVCPFCSVRYQYYRDVLNKLLGCQSCGKSFTGYEVTAQGAASRNNLSQSVFPKQKGAGNQGPSKVGPQSNVENTTKVEVKGNSSNGNQRFSEVATGSKPNEKIGDANVNGKNQKRKAEKPQPRGNMNGKRRRQLSESSESCNSETSTESEEEVSIKSGGFCSEQLPRRSSRCKRNVSYSENIIDDIDTTEPSGGNDFSATAPPTADPVEDSSPKEASPSTNKSTGLDADVELNEKVPGKEPSVHAGRLRTEGNGTENEKPTEDAETEPEIYAIPDPDFTDFDKEREEDCFTAGQIWAIYDTRDAMPRYYAHIRKVLRPHFKLRITWLELEPDPDDKDEIKWSEEDLPISCGNFRHGSSENTEDHRMFSHLVSWEKGRGRDTFLIYPRKGETWALFKNWDINWSSDPDNKRNFTYEFVEILSDYTDGIAISVTYLVKVKGFSFLFCRTKRGDELFKISPKELFRFSHRIPSFRLTGKEREDVPAGSYELDPACLPTNIHEIDAPANGETVTENMHSVGSCSKLATEWAEQIPKFHVNVSKNQAETKSHSDTHVDISTEEEDQNLQSDSNLKTVDNPTDDSGVTPAYPEEAYEIPDPEFYNFDEDKSVEKLEIGQIWALYCDEDGLPKYYGIIKKIDIQPELKLHITWLVVKSTPNGMIQWIDKKMPITCGRFTHKKMKKLMQYTSTGTFSHQVRARVERTSKKDEYLIFPRKGEVWALYKNWNAGMKCFELENCEYQMVEVVEENDLGISVLILEPVHDFKSVFKPLTITIMIPSNELLRFSHQIPAFRLTDERDGSLRGYLELDPAALPFEWFCSH